MSVLLILQAFGIATLISFAGSVQLGPVNFGTIQTALSRDFKSALYFGFGGSLPELLYCGLAFGGANLIAEYDGLDDYLQYGTTVILFVFGIYLLLQKPSVTKNDKPEKPGKRIWVGMTFGLLNPQLFPFWLIVISNLRSYNILVDDNVFVQSAFVLGTAAGAFLLQYLVAVITTKKKDYLYTKLTKNYNQVLGSVIIAVAIIQLIVNL
jgi:threonine/homoserine/homoserine lactone efflux protein